ncbi:armadillo-type protein [Mycena olivaceomarginata]|nr:armadillo-type protein [Mycena olivaceomarginata]
MRAIFLVLCAPLVFPAGSSPAPCTCTMCPCESRAGALSWDAELRILRTPRLRCSSHAAPACRELARRGRSTQTRRSTWPAASPQAYNAGLGYDSQMLNMYASNLSSIASFGQPMHGNRRQDTQQEFASPRSPILDEFRASGKPKTTWKLRDIAGSVVEFSGDQLGSCFIQDELPKASSEERQSVFDEIVPGNTLQLIQDVFGNYVIQKLFEHGTQAQKTVLANTMEGNVLHQRARPRARRAATA